MCRMLQQGERIESEDQQRDCDNNGVSNRVLSVTETVGGARGEKGARPVQGLDRDCNGRRARRS